MANTMTEAVANPGGDIAGCSEARLRGKSHEQESRYELNQTDS
jgi:hypothetical protein